MPKLQLKFNAAVLKEIEMSKAAVTVGRKPDNDVVIDNPAISGHHCRITLEGETYYVEDLESTNGTYVNQKRVKKAGLHHNDVVGLAKHALVFVEENPGPQGQPTQAGPASDATVMISQQKQEEMVAQAAASAKETTPKVGLLRVLEGGVGEPEYELKGMSTYIGKSDRVQIPIKGTGLFGSAPEVACSVHRKPEGFVLLAVADGYPVVNGQSVSGSVVLKEGDEIVCGGTRMQFVLTDAAAKSAKKPA